ncbi:MAG: sigma-70 family RNA polymerase sigma factor [Syntrophomonadaceae bacterium]|nr:sigma-70 family RNA polymerase sigma factor [Syntrophomonadaceae bacterium]
MISDEMLVEQTLTGDISAFEEIVNRYKNSVFAIAYRMTGQYQEAEDISQDIFINLYEKMYQFDGNKKLSPWIHRIAVNTSISALRKKKNMVSLSFDEAFVPNYEAFSGFDMHNPQFQVESKELKAEINAAIMELPESYRAVITLRYQMDFNNQEIAGILGTSRDNVEVRIHRARKALRRVILKRCQERGIINELSRD